MEKRIFLPLLILVYFALAVGYSIVTPAATADQHNPDENAHMEYVAKMASGHLPVFTDPQHGYEFHQPPLYYALCVPVYLATRGHGEAAATKAVRSVSILLGALLIWVTFRCIQTLVPSAPFVGLGTAVFVGLLPGNLALAASVSNDALTNLVCVLCLWRMAVLTAKTGSCGREPLWIGLILGVGVWTKTSTLVLFPVTLLVYYLLLRQGRFAAATVGRAFAVSAGIGGLIGLPWLLRNTLLYGDPIAQHLFETAFSGTAQADVITRVVFGGSIFAYMSGVGAWTFASFWGVFDSMRLFWGQSPLGRTPSPAALSLPIYNLLALLSAASVVGLVLGKRRTQLTPSQSAMMTAFGALISLVLFVFLRFILTFFQAQGRYLYPALLPLSFFFVWGWSGLLPRPLWFRGFIGLMTIGLIGLNLYTLLALLLPRFS